MQGVSTWLASFPLEESHRNRIEGQGGVRWCAATLQEPKYPESDKANAWHLMLITKTNRTHRSAEDMPRAPQGWKIADLTRASIPSCGGRGTSFVRFSGEGVGAKYTNTHK